jgi:hypothetical protein
MRLARKGRRIAEIREEKTDGYFPCAVWVA